MHLVVHFGTFKTGTTSIQQLFHRNQAAFLEQGILYPKVPSGPAHHLLFALFQQAMPARIPLQLGLDPAAMADQGRRAWEDIRREVARRRPDTLVLSSELFLMNPTLDGFRRFRALLEPLDARITLCCYVRAPAPYYLSYVQQNARMSGEVSPPQPLAIRKAVECVEAAFGQPMVLRAFDPAQLVDGDVVQDFLREIVGCSIPPDVPRGQRFNESLSAEAMSISVANRRANFAGHDHRPHPEHQRLLNLMQDLEPEVGGSARPRLRPEVPAAVTRASDDLLWLRETRGIVFPGIDYRAIDGHMPAEIASLQEIDRICEVDPARRDRLLLRLLQGGIEAEVALSRLERILPVRRILAAKRRLQARMSR